MAIYTTCIKAYLAEILFSGFNTTIFDAKSKAKGSNPLTKSKI